LPPFDVTARAGDPAETEADTRVVAVFEGEEIGGELQALVDSGEAKSAPKKTAVAHVDGKRVVLVGAGKREEFDSEAARVAAAAAAGRASELGARALSWDVPAEPEGIVHGTLLAAYKFERFKSSKENGNGLASLELVGDGLEEAARTAAIEAEAQNAARDLQNLPANVATPSYLAERAKELEGVEVEVLDRDACEQLGMGAFVSVAQGTYEPSFMIVMRYDGGSGPHLGYVGKAMTFDSGGISIKPASKMHEMKFDMSGGAAVIEGIGAIARLGLPARVTGVVAATENMPSGRSTRPGDIVTAMNGTTIEVNNTDAEGRLVLADALAYAVEQGAERLVDLATLTGAIITALGHTHCGLFSNDDDWAGAVEAACSATGELGWRLPLHPEYEELTKGRYADLQNVGDAPQAGSIYGAEFLKRFVDGRPWVHMDIAGTAWGMKRNYTGSGASGFGVRTLVELARSSSRN